MLSKISFLLTFIFCFSSFFGYSQTTTSFYTSAHPDDWQLFMNPNAYESVKNKDEKTVFIHTTAGDAGTGMGNNDYTLAREKGSLRAIRFMENAFTSGEEMKEQLVTINGHAIRKYVYRNTVAYFLRIPDGSPDGAGYPLHEHRSLQKLYTGETTDINTVDGSTQYSSLNDLKTTLKALIELEASDTEKWTYHVADTAGSLNPNDHSDHQYSSKIVQDVARELGKGSINLYIDYHSNTLPLNVFDAHFLLCAGTWGATASGLSDMGHYSTWDNAHNSWIGRQYYRTVMIGKSFEKKE